MLIIRVIIDSTVHCLVLHTVHRNFQKVQLLVNAFRVFREFYRGHSSHDFRAQGVTLKSKALATKCIFQIYSQSLDICTRLVLKTGDELLLSSVLFWYYTQLAQWVQPTRHQKILNCWHFIFKHILKSQIVLSILPQLQRKACHIFFLRVLIYSTFS